MEMVVYLILKVNIIIMLEKNITNSITIDAIFVETYNF